MSPASRPDIARTLASAARALASGLCLLVCSLCVFACGGVIDAHPAPLSPHALVEAQTFPYYRVYWVGRRFGTHPLAAADGRKSYNSAIGDSLYYGDCVPGKTPALGGGGCELPLQVTTVIYRLHSNAALGPQRNALLRGVPATIYDGGRSIELYSGRLAIDIFSDTLLDALHAVRALRPVNAPGSALRPLPPPVYCPVLTGPQPPAVQHVMQHLPGHACQRAAAALAAHEALYGKPEPPLSSRVGRPSSR